MSQFCCQSKPSWSVMCDFSSTDCPPISLHILGYVALFGNTICMVSAVFHSPIPRFLGLGMRLNDEGVLVVTVQTLLLPHMQSFYVLVQKKFVFNSPGSKSSLRK